MANGMRQIERVDYMPNLTLEVATPAVILNLRRIHRGRYLCMMPKFIAVASKMVSQTIASATTHTGIPFSPAEKIRQKKVIA